MEDEIEFWMEANSVKRIVRMAGGGWGVYLEGDEPFGTGASLLEALDAAEART
jgi:hypothetical protein